MARWQPGSAVPVQAPGPCPVTLRVVSLVWAGLSVWWLPGAYADAAPLYLRNHSPFLHAFGLPAPEGGRLSAPGRLSTSLVTSLANHADSGESAAESGGASVDEAVVLDGESYFADLTLRYGLTERWEVGLDMPYVAHHNGTLDNLIEDWHDTFGLPNDERRGPSNELLFSYRRNGVTEAMLRDAGGGLGDLRVTTGYRLSADPGSRRLVALRGVVKLPTGDVNRLRGSGGTDLALSLDASDRATLGDRSAVLFAQAGVLLLGAGDLLPEQQRDVVPFGSAGLSWQWTPALALRLQFGAQGKYFDSNLDELGAGTLNVAAGGVIRLRRLGIEVDVAFVEDLISDATPDFGLHLALRRITTTLSDDRDLAVR